MATLRDANKCDKEYSLEAGGVNRQDGSCKLSTLAKLVHRNKYVPISEHDIRKICDGKVNVIPYSLLETMYKTSQPITQLFKPEFNNCVVLLYQLQGTLGVGHWVSLIFDEDTGILNFFNPYGFGIDQEINLMTHSDLYLTKLLKQSKMRVNINTFRFQVLKDDISTCGMHAAIRCVFNELDNSEYYRFMREAGYGKVHDFDELVSLMCIIPLKLNIEKVQ